MRVQVHKCAAHVWEDVASVAAASMAAAVPNLPAMAFKSLTAPTPTPRDALLETCTCGGLTKLVKA